MWVLQPCSSGIAWLLDKSRFLFLQSCNTLTEHLSRASVTDRLCYRPGAVTHLWSICLEPWASVPKSRHFITLCFINWMWLRTKPDQATLDTSLWQGCVASASLPYPVFTTTLDWLSHNKLIILALHTHKLRRNVAIIKPGLKATQAEQSAFCILPALVLGSHGTEYSALGSVRHLLFLTNSLPWEVGQGCCCIFQTLKTWANIHKVKMKGSLHNRDGLLFYLWR